MLWWNRLLHNSSGKPLLIRARSRLSLEYLETRALPASVLVVPMTFPVDGTHFHTLSDACTAAGTGGTVTVEPGSGDSNNEDVTVTQPGITIQGVSYESAPGGHYNITVRAESVSIINLNVGVRFGGGFGHTTIRRCLAGITQLPASAGNGDDLIMQNNLSELSLSGTTDDVVSHNYFLAVDPGIDPWHRSPLLDLSNAYGALVESNSFVGSH
jgi:hypothetical protein